MFDIGFQELIIIFVVALLVFGPEKLPEVGRTLGKWMIEIRRGIQHAKVQMESEVSDLEKEADRGAVNPPQAEEGPRKDDKPSPETEEKV